MTSVLLHSRLPIYVASANGRYVNAVGKSCHITTVIPGCRSTFQPLLVVSSLTPWMMHVLEMLMLFLLRPEVK